MENIINQYECILQKEGYKLTNQRKEILNVMYDKRHEHLSCEDVHEIISKENPELGIATVYRTLQLFEKLNIVYKINFDDGLSRYELNLGTENHQHHHLICIKCGKVKEVKLDLLEALEDQIEREGNFEIIDHNVKFYGYCEDCKTGEKKPED